MPQLEFEDDEKYLLLLFQFIEWANDESQEGIEIQDFSRLVSIKPALLRVVYNGYTVLSYIILCHGGRAISDRCLLGEYSIIKFLIQSDPSTLLLEDGGGNVPIVLISDTDLCILMPWIAAHYDWVLDHEHGKQSVFMLLGRFSCSKDTPECTATIIKQFFEAYPRGLEQEDHDGDTPLHIMSKGVQCDVDLFKWMAQKYPSSMKKENRYGNTPLHVACSSLSRHKGSTNIRNICRHLIANCPQSVRSLNGWHYLPIHLLHLFRLSSRDPFVREVAVSLLREYPESYGISSGRSMGGYDGVPKTYPFMQHVKPFLDKEKELIENANQLRVISTGTGEIQGALSTAISTTRDELMRSTAKIFNSWALSFAQGLDDKANEIKSQLDHACVHFDDGSSSSDDDSSLDGETISALLHISNLPAPPNI